MASKEEMASVFKIKSLETYLKEDEDEFPGLVKPGEYASSTVNQSMDFNEVNSFCEKIEDKGRKENDKFLDGAITTLLNNSMGVLPPVDRFPVQTKQKSKLLESPAIITNDKIPVLLDEAFFKFPSTSNDGNKEMKKTEKSKYCNSRELYKMKRNK